jgi:hypothetical protein
MGHCDTMRSTVGVSDGTVEVRLPETFALG